MKLYDLNKDYQLSVQALGPRWKSLDGSRIFLTGGTGFFGQWLINTFLTAQKNYNFKSELVLLSRNPEKLAQNNPHFSQSNSISFHQGDIRNFSFPAGDFTHVIHGAVDVAPSLTSHTSETFDVLYNGAQRILEFAESKKVSNFHFLSSGAVYGHSHGAISVNQPETYQSVIPKSLYAEGKRMAEWLTLQRQNPEMNIKISRCFAFTGPHLPLDAPLAVSNFIKHILQSEDIILKSDGRAVRSYMYGADLSSWLWAHSLDNSPCSIINVGSPEPISVLDLAKQLIHISGSKIRVRIDPNHKPSTADDSYYPETTSSEELLKLKIQVPLNLALEKSLQYWKEIKA